MKVSIIIPVKYINDYIRETIAHCLQLDYDDFEVIIFPDEVRAEDWTIEDENVVCFERNISIQELEKCDKIVRIIPSGQIGPAEKRDLAFKYALGKIFAFTDDDAYPRRDWLKNATDILKADDVGAVGGPAVTVCEDDIWKLGSGKVYESFLCSGGYTYRYLPGIKKEDDDIPSVNLIVKRDVFEQIKGYDSTFYPGEDTKLCLDIVNTGKKLIYAPEVLVYHHRRSLFKGHLKQITNYAKHRGYFVKVLPQTSMRISYFVPTAFVLGIIFGPFVCMMLPSLWYVYWGVIIGYVVLASISLKSCFRRDLGYSYSTDNNIAHSIFFRIRLFMLSLMGIFATHIGYGICFVKGLLSKELLR